MYKNITGLEAWHNSRAVGGVDVESDAALVGRYYDYLRKPATSGNVYHYERWALEIPGVGAVRVTPLAYGPGTVDVLVVNQHKQPIDAESDVLEQVAAHIETQRPIGAVVTVRTPIAVPIRVVATVDIDPSTTAELVQAALASNLDTYIQSIAFVQDELLYNRVVYLLLSIDGVRDYQTLTVNGGTGNVEMDRDHLPVLGEVTVNATA